MSGKFPLMIFGLPGAALAMYRSAKDVNKKVVGGLLFSAALTSLLTGITEPIEFTFLFVAPILYGIHCIFAGAAYMLMHIFNVGVGMTFSGGLIDLFLFGILQGNSKTNWIWVVIIGIVYFVVYYFLFTFLIKKMDLKTPGRGDDEVKLYTRKDVDAKNTEKDGSVETVDEKSRMISIGLGGYENIEDVDSCATRLRCTVKDPSLVKEDILKSTGAAGVVKSGRGVQVIYGPVVSVIKSNLEEYLQKPADENLDEYDISTEEKKEDQVKEEADEAKSITLNLYSPMKGKTVHLENLSDEAFSSKIVGDGIAIEPENGQVFSPVDGKVMMLFETKHAIGLVTDSGAEILIHIGMDTVNLKGEGFEAFVKNGDTVKRGEKIIEVDLELLKSKGYILTTPMVITNTFDFSEINPVEEKNVDISDIILNIKK